MRQRLVILGAIFGLILGATALGWTQALPSWNLLKDKPTTLDTYGITDGLKVNLSNFQNSNLDAIGLSRLKDAVAADPLTVEELYVWDMGYVASLTANEAKITKLRVDNLYTGGTTGSITISLPLHLLRIASFSGGVRFNTGDVTFKEGFLATGVKHIYGTTSFNGLTTFNDSPFFNKPLNGIKASGTTVIDSLTVKNYFKSEVEPTFSLGLTSQGPIWLTSGEWSSWVSAQGFSFPANGEVAGKFTARSIRLNGPEPQLPSDGELCFDTMTKNLKLWCGEQWYSIWNASESYTVGGLTVSTALKVDSVATFTKDVTLVQKLKGNTAEFKSTLQAADIVVPGDIVSLGTGRFKSLQTDVSFSAPDDPEVGTMWLKPEWHLDGGQMVTTEYNLKMYNGTQWYTIFTMPAD